MQSHVATYRQIHAGYAVPVEHANVHELVEQFVRDVLDKVEQFGDVSHVGEPEEIENESRSGFIPFTEGGWIGWGYANLNYAHGSGCIPAAIQPIIDSALIDCMEQFFEDEGAERIAFDNPERAKILSDRYEALSDEDKERYWEYEDTWLSEGGTYFYKVRAIYYAPDNSDNASGEPEVYFDAYLNTDLEYGRDYISWLPCLGGNADQTSGKFTRVVRVADVTPELIETLTKEAVEHLIRL